MTDNIKLTDVFENSFLQIREQINIEMFISALLVALIAAFAASLMYRFFYERRGTGSQVHRSFPLLAIAITTLFIGVQISIPLSLGLLGSLSIIRFRTPIKEPEEVGFIMLVIAAAISAATFNFYFVFVLYIIAFVTLVVMRWSSMCKWLKRDGILVLVLDECVANESMDKVVELIKKNMKRSVLESSSVRDSVATYQYVFSGLKCEVSQFQKEISMVAKCKSVSVFLDRPGGIR